MSQKVATEPPQAFQSLVDLFSSHSTGSPQSSPQPLAARTKFKRSSGNPTSTAKTGGSGSKSAKGAAPSPGSGASRRAPESKKLSTATAAAAGLKREDLQKHAERTGRGDPKRSSSKMSALDDSRDGSADDGEHNGDKPLKDILTLGCDLSLRRFGPDSSRVPFAHELDLMNPIGVAQWAKFLWVLWRAQFVSLEPAASVSEYSGNGKSPSGGPLYLFVITKYSSLLALRTRISRFDRNYCNRLTREMAHAHDELVLIERARGEKCDGLLDNNQPTFRVTEKAKTPTSASSKPARTAKRRTPRTRDSESSDGSGRRSLRPRDSLAMPNRFGSDDGDDLSDIEASPSSSHEPKRSRRTESGEALIAPRSKRSRLIDGSDSEHSTQSFRDAAFLSPDAAGVFDPQSPPVKLGDVKREPIHPADMYTEQFIKTESPDARHRRHRQRHHHSHRHHHHHKRSASDAEDPLDSFVRVMSPPSVGDKTERKGEKAAAEVDPRKRMRKQARFKFGRGEASFSCRFLHSGVKRIRYVEPLPVYTYGAILRSNLREEDDRKLRFIPYFGDGDWVAFDQRDMKLFDLRNDGGSDNDNDVENETVVRMWKPAEVAKLRESDKERAERGRAVTRISSDDESTFAPESLRDAMDSLVIFFCRVCNTYECQRHLKCKNNICLSKFYSTFRHMANSTKESPDAAQNLHRGRKRGKGTHSRSTSPERSSAETSGAGVATAAEHEIPGWTRREVVLLEAGVRIAGAHDARALALIVGTKSEDEVRAVVTEAKWRRMADETVEPHESDDDSEDEDSDEEDPLITKLMADGCEKNALLRTRCETTTDGGYATVFPFLHEVVRQGKSIKPVTFSPCSHRGPCSSRRCSCIQNGQFCDRTCVNSGSYVRHPGVAKESLTGKSNDDVLRSEDLTRNMFPCCQCQGSCNTRQCKCFAANRECDSSRCGCKAACMNAQLQQHQHKRVFVGPSDVHGWGLFLGEPARRGDFVCEYVGELISSEEAERRGKFYDKRRLTYLFNLTSDSAIDACRKGGKAKYINHSDSPNCYCKIMYVRGDYRIGIYARRDVMAGEELFFDYHFGGDHKKDFV